MPDAAPDPLDRLVTMREVMGLLRDTVGELLQQTLARSLPPPVGIVQGRKASSTTAVLDDDVSATPVPVIGSGGGSSGRILAVRLGGAVYVLRAL